MCWGFCLVLLIVGGTISVVFGFMVKYSFTQSSFIHFEEYTASLHDIIKQTKDAVGIMIGIKKKNNC